MIAPGRTDACPGDHSGESFAVIRSISTSAVGRRFAQTERKCAKVSPFGPFLLAT